MMRPRSQNPAQRFCKCSPPFSSNRLPPDLIKKQIAKQIRPAV